jgi:short-subunit dehydrogenase
VWRGDSPYTASMSTKKIVVVTGATSGIGKELAKCFAINGYSVIIVARDLQKLQKTAAEFHKQYGADVSIIQADLSLQNSAQKVFEALAGRIPDVLVNNAGFAEYGLFAENDLDMILGSIRLNIETLTHLTKLIVPLMVDRRTGKILNVASTAAFQPGPMMAVYFATKAYVLSFSEAIRFEFKDTGVTISTLCPGATETDFQKKSDFGKSNLIKKGGMMKADDVARQGYLGLMEGKAIIIPGFRNKIGVFMLRFSPRSLVLKIVYKLNKTE